MDISIVRLSELDSTSPVPMYRQIAESITACIADQTLPPGAKLPPERQLAVQCGVSRTTAINAYRRLEELGLVRTRIGSGTYVTDAVDEAAVAPVPWRQLLVPQSPSPLVGIIRDLVSIDITDKTISLGTGMPDPALYPMAAFNALLTGSQAPLSPADMGHMPTEGYLPLRRLLADRMAAKGMTAAAGNVAVVSGSQQGLYLLARVFINPGDYVVTETPTYLGAAPIFRAAGARVLTMPAAGPLKLDILEDYLIRYRPKLLYMMTTFQNPTGRVMPLAERRELLALAARHRLIIIEDDPYGELYYDQLPPPSLKALDPYGGVIYLSTFSKVLFPGLRMGWIVAPEPVVDRLALEKQYVDLHSANLSQWLLARYLAGGLLADHLAMIRKEYKKRRDVTAGALKRYCGGQLDFTVPAGGFYFWCELTHPSATTRQLLHEATRLGVTFVPGEAFYPDGEGQAQFRLCFVTNPEPVLEEGVKRLGKALTGLAKKFPRSGRDYPQVSKPII